MGKKVNPALENIQLKRQINELLLRLADAEARLDIIKDFTIQQALDEAQIAHHECEGWGPVRNKRFEEVFLRNIYKRAASCVLDGKDDVEIVYTKECLDRELRRARGEDTPPFDVRYDLDNLHFRKKMGEQLREENKK